MNSFSKIDVKMLIDISLLDCAPYLSYQNNRVKRFSSLQA